MNKRNPMTTAGHRALQEELQHLKSVERPKIIEEIEVARAHGDLRENAEYHAAKEKYGHIDGRISAIAEKLATAEVVNPAELSSGKIIFGATVIVEDVDSGEKITYQIVGEDESDVKSGRINYLSPIARALLGKTTGDEVEVTAPKGKRTFEILEVTFR